MILPAGKRRRKRRECSIFSLCRFRGQVEEDGSYPLKYWRLWTAKLAFIIVFEVIIFTCYLIVLLLISTASHIYSWSIAGLASS